MRELNVREQDVAIELKETIDLNLYNPKSCRKLVTLHYCSEKCPMCYPPQIAVWNIVYYDTVNYDY